MLKKIMIIFLILGNCIILAANEKNEKEDRQIPVKITVDVNSKVIKRGEPIPLSITISNGLPLSIFHSRFSIKSNDWNGETYNISLVDIYRDNASGNLYLARPQMKVPDTISGPGREEIRSGGNIVIRTDARKWKLRDDWLPGKYKVTLRVDNLTVDKYSKLSILSDPVEFEIK